MTSTRDGEIVSVMPPNRIEWLSDLVRLEIVLWSRIDSRLRDEHDLPLAFFWPLYVVERSPNESLRVGEVATALGITVGGASKIVDRIAGAGFLSREPDPADRRASRVALTDAGRRKLDAACKTYEAEMATVLDAALSPDQQQCMHKLVLRLLESADAGDSI